ncbi:hypothetical protein DLAC_11112 [Tieghemostelium lacteum]|uniref:F-box domain-containing protein n=1 Tax=Tieghemostelium lacteum TaxID=361077 RepID=A0A151Z389_TIELA|nr:hypothetical protein DLAC_11112 [Tieghemostelium lacteum]|eukprot:KYQ88411.1 hypothetical protein DLAC_11112 [Tieghemostelium lacteum]
MIKLPKYIIIQILTELLGHCEESPIFIRKCVNTIGLVCREWRDVYLLEKLSINNYSLKSIKRYLFFKEMSKRIPFYNLKLLSTEQSIEIPADKVLDISNVSHDVYIQPLSTNMTKLARYKNITRITLSNCIYTTLRDFSLLVQYPKLTSIYVTYLNAKKKISKQLDTKDYFQGVPDTQFNHTIEDITISTMDNSAEPFVLHNITQFKRFTKLFYISLDRLSVDLNNLIELLDQNQSIEYLSLDSIIFLESSGTITSLNHFLQLFSNCTNSKVNILNIHQIEDLDKKVLVSLINSSLPIENLTLMVRKLITTTTEPTETKTETQSTDTSEMEIKNTRLKHLYIYLSLQLILDIHCLWRSQSSIESLVLAIPNFKLQDSIQHHLKTLKSLTVPLNEVSMPTYIQLIISNLPNLKELVVVPKSNTIFHDFSSLHTLISSLVYNNNNMDTFSIQFENLPMEIVSQFLELNHPTIKKFECISIKNLDMATLAKSLKKNQNLTSFIISKSGAGSVKKDVPSYVEFINYLTMILQQSPQFNTLKIPQPFDPIILGNEIKLNHQKSLDALELAISKSNIYTLTIGNHLDIIKIQNKYYIRDN